MNETSTTQEPLFAIIGGWNDGEWRATALFPEYGPQHYIHFDVVKPRDRRDVEVVKQYTGIVRGKEELVTIVREVRSKN